MCYTRTNHAFYGKTYVPMQDACFHGTCLGEFLLNAVFSERTAGHLPRRFPDLIAGVNWSLSHRIREEVAKIHFFVAFEVTGARNIGSSIERSSFSIGKETELTALEFFSIGNRNPTVPLVLSDRENFSIWGIFHFQVVLGGVGLIWSAERLKKLKKSSQKIFMLTRSHPDTWRAAGGVVNKICYWLLFYVVYCWP